MEALETLGARRRCRLRCCSHLETVGVKLVFPERTCLEEEGDERSGPIQRWFGWDGDASIRSSLLLQFYCCYVIACDPENPVMVFQQEVEAWDERRNQEVMALY